MEKPCTLLRVETKSEWQRKLERDTHKEWDESFPEQEGWTDPEQEDKWEKTDRAESLRHGPISGWGLGAISWGGGKLPSP